MLKNKVFKNLHSKQFKNFLIYGLGQVVNLISPLLVLPYIITICGEEGIGKAGVGFSFALIAIVLVDCGSYINGTKSIAININNKLILQEKFIVVYLAKFIILIIVLILCLLIIYNIPFFKKDACQFVFSLLIIVGQFLNPTWFLQGTQNFKWISIINFLSKIIYVITILLFIKNSKDYIYINALLGISSIIASMIGFCKTYSQYSISFRNIPFKKAIELIKEEFSLTISQLFFSLYQYAPIILVSFTCGNFMAGQFRIVDQVIMIFRTYFQMFFNFIYPSVCFKIHINIKSGLNYWKSNNVLNYMIILILLMFFSYYTEFILIFLKVAKTELPKLVTLFRVGLLIPVFMGISFTLKQLIFAFNKNEIYIKTTILSTILSLLTMYLFLRNIGLLGAFLTTIIIEFFIIITYLVILRKYLLRTK